MKNNNLINCILKALLSGAICWIAFAFGTFIVAHKNASFLDALQQGRAIAFGVMMALVSFLSYWMKRKK